MGKREIDFGISTDKLDKSFDRAIEKLSQTKDAVSDLNKADTNKGSEAIKKFGDASETMANKTKKAVNITIKELKKLEDIKLSIKVNKKSHDITGLFPANKDLKDAVNQLDNSKEKIKKAIDSYASDITNMRQKMWDYDAKGKSHSKLTKGLFDEKEVEKAYNKFISENKDKLQGVKTELIKEREELYSVYASLLPKKDSFLKKSNFSDLSLNKSELKDMIKMVEVAKMIQRYNDQIGVSDSRFDSINVVDLQQKISQMAEKMITKGISANYEQAIKNLEIDTKRLIDIVTRMQNGEDSAFDEIKTFASNICKPIEKSIKDAKKLNKELLNAERYVDETKKNFSSLSKKTADTYSTYSTFNKHPKNVKEGVATDKEIQYVGEVANLLRNNVEGKFDGHPGLDYFNRLIEKKPELEELANTILNVKQVTDDTKKSVDKPSSTSDPVNTEEIEKQTEAYNKLSAAKERAKSLGIDVSKFEVVDESEIKDIDAATDAVNKLIEAKERAGNVGADKGSVGKINGEVKDLTSSYSKLNNEIEEWVDNNVNRQLSPAIYNFDDHKNAIQIMQDYIAKLNEIKTSDGYDTLSKSIKDNVEQSITYLSNLIYASENAIKTQEKFNNQNTLDDKIRKMTGTTAGDEYNKYFSMLDQGMKIDEILEQVRKDFDLTYDEASKKWVKLSSLMKKKPDKTEFLSGTTATAPIEESIRLQDNLGREIDENNAKLLKGTQLIDAQNKSILTLYHNSETVFDKFDAVNQGGHGSELGQGNYLAGDSKSYNDIDFGRYQTQWYAFVENIFDIDSKFSAEQIQKLISMFLKGTELEGTEAFNNIVNTLNSDKGLSGVRAIANATGKTFGEIFGAVGYDAIAQYFNGNIRQINVFDSSKIVRANDIVDEIPYAKQLSAAIETIADNYEMLDSAEKKVFDDDQKKEFWAKAIVDYKNEIDSLLGRYPELKKFIDLIRESGLDDPDEIAEKILKESPKGNQAPLPSEGINKAEQEVQEFKEKEQQASTETTDIIVANNKEQQQSAENTAQSVENASDRITNAQEKVNNQNKVPKSLQFNIEDLDEKGLIQKIKSAENAINSGSSTADLWKEKLPLMQEALDNLVKQREEQERIAEETRKANLEAEKKVALEKDYGSNAIKQKGLIGDEDGWTITNRTGAAQTQNVVYSFDDKTGDLITTEMPIVTNFEQLTNLIVKADSNLAKMQETLKRNKAALGDAYDSSYLEKAISSTKEYIEALEKEAKTYGTTNEYAADYKKFLDQRQKNKDLSENLAKDKTSQSAAREENKHAEAVNRTNEYLAKQRNELKKLQHSYDATLNAKKPIVNNDKVAKADQDALTAIYNEIDQAITSYQNANKTLTSKEKIYLQDKFSELKLKKLELQNKYFGSTTLSATELSSNKSVISDNYDTLISKAKEAGSYTSDLVQRLELERKSIDSIGDSNGVQIETDKLKAYRAEFNKLQQEERARNKSQKDNNDAYNEQYKIIENYSDAQDKLNDLLGQQAKQGKSDELTTKINNQRQEVEKLKLEAIEASKVLSTMNKSGLITKDQKRVAQDLLKDTSSGKTDSYSVLNGILNDKASKHKSEIDEIVFKYEKLGLTSDEIKHKLQDLYNAQKEVNKSSSDSVEERIQKELNYQEVLKSTNAEFVKFDRQNKINANSQRKSNNAVKENNKAYKEQYKVLENYSKEQDKLNTLFMQQEKKGKSNELTAKIKEQTKEVERLKLEAKAAYGIIQQMSAAGSISIGKLNKAYNLYNNVKDGKTQSFSVLEGVKKDQVGKAKNNYSDDLPWMKSEVTKYLKNLNTELGTFEKLTNVKTDGTATITFVNELSDSTQRATVQVKDLLQVLIDLQSDNFDPKKLGEYKITEVNRKDVEKAYKVMADTEEDYRKLSIKRTAGTATKEQLAELKEIQEDRNKAASVIKAKTAATEAETEAQRKYNDIQEQTNQKLNDFVNNEQTVKSLMTSSSQMLDGFKNKNIEGSDIAFSYANEKVKQLNESLQNGKISAEKYSKEILKVSKELNSILIGNVESDDAENGMYKYFRSIGVSTKDIEKFDNVNKTLTATFKDQNKNIHKVTLGYDELSQTIKEIKHTTEKSKSLFVQFFDGLKNRMMALGQYLLSFASFYRVISVVRQGITVVRELDVALTEMRKVSDETVSSLKRFQDVSFDIAGSVGTTAVEIQNSAAQFMRLGYSLQEASELAKDANIYANVGDMEIAEATEHMISSIKAWKSEFSSEVEASEAIIDRYNKIGNNFAISSADIGSAMERSAAALKAGGNTLNESLGLIVSGNIIQQDAETTAAALKIMSLRIRGSKTE